ncbi:DUF3267 domain-containing protein [Salinicoccus luteus]|uniref:DUF3267 domain-containing protein n=1 Tax=Salinicoccus luteus TaxID=367840 RepID=UPI000ABAF0E3|nr:DUF3267 domain-containing protein [Salinicoccus luteus]
MGNKYVLDIFKDTSAMKALNILSISITVLSFIVFYLLDLFLADDAGSALIGMESFGIIGAVLLIMAILFAIITVHEGIHGLFFKLFHPKGKVRFGYKSGMFYATAPGEVFTRRQFVIAVLMPFVVITSVMLLMMFTVPHGAYKYLLALHTGACAGDFYYVYLIMKHRNMEYVEDTEVGMTMYEANPADS